MSGTDEQPGTPGEQGVEPGHRARALAASLLGELTGQRRGGLSAVPGTGTPGPGADPSPAPVAAAEPGDVASEATLRSPAPTPVDLPALASVPTAPAAADADVAWTDRPDDLAAAGPADPAAPRTAAPGPDPEPGDGPGSDAPVRVAAEDPAAAPTGPRWAGSTPGATGTRPLSSVRGPESAPSPPAVASASLPVRVDVPGRGAGTQDVRPAPFSYLSVAQHHTVPARATANGALDSAGQRISSRVDRALARRAAQVTMEAASLLDACDTLDARAQAVDGTWTGEHHSATEVREFEGAWGAFYDAQAALAQHVVG